MLVRDSIILQSFKENYNVGGDLLFERYYKPLVLFADSMITDRVFAEDLVQEVFYRFIKEKVYESIAPGALSTYLFHAVRNACVNSLNAKNVVYSELDVLRYDAIEEESKTIDPELILSIHRAIGELPEKTRSVVQDILLKGKKYKEVAVNYDISVNTVKTLLANGLKQVRRRFANSDLILLILKMALRKKK